MVVVSARSIVVQVLKYFADVKGVLVTKQSTLILILLEIRKKDHQVACAA